MKGKNIAIDHIAKQKKKKDLGDNMVYSSLNGVVEMHPLGKVKLSAFDNKELEKIIKGLMSENKELNKRLDKVKPILKDFNEKIKEHERKMKKYGII